MAALALGVEVGSTAVRYAAVRPRRTSRVVEHVGEVPLDEGVVVDGEVADQDALTAAVRTLVKKARIGHKPVRLGLVSQRSVARQAELPWVPPKDLPSALPLLAADELPVPVEDCILDFLPYERLHSRDSDTVRGLLVAGPQEGIVEAINAVEAAGLLVDSVTLTPLSTLSVVADAYAPGPEVVVDIGFGMTCVTIHQNAQPRFVRILSRGGRDITTSLAEQLSMSADDAERWKCALPGMWQSMSAGDRTSTEHLLRAALTDVVLDIRTSIDYYATSEGVRPIRGYVVGGAANTLGLVPILAAALRIPVTAAIASIPEQGTSMSAAESSLAHSPRMAAAVSLAMGAVA